ncbi:MAG TPA: hypothetical protein PKC80_07195 [Burkholderiaceae bacterium]|nr:hypothetical protein [Burkholderiaceae bacterium]
MTTLHRICRQFSIMLLLNLLGTACFSDPLAFPQNKRWVNGSGVNLREQASLAAPVITHMVLNTTVNLIAATTNGKFCEVELVADGQPTLHGFTACEYLSTSIIKPREISNVYLDDNKTPNPNYNPERAFWLKPSYEALAEYGRYLERKRKNPKNDTEAEQLAGRPKIPEFERMKEHLAKGILLTPPAPYLRWVDLKAKARNMRNEERKVIKKFGSIDNVKSKDWIGSTLDKQSEYLIGVLDLRTLDGNQGRFGIYVPPKLLSFIEYLELPTITSSYFQNQNEIAAPTTHTEKIAAKFQIIQTIQTRYNKLLTKDDQFERAGIWDISEVTRSLTHPVFKNTLFNLGNNIQSESTYLRVTYPEVGDTELSMCEDYEGGFDFGDADPMISINYAKNNGHADYERPKKNGNKLMYFFTKHPLPQQTSSVNVVKQKLIREKTGFVASKEFHFDINSDGITDLLVWEGVGIGPGHLDGPTKTDDAWYRAFFVNIAGHWHLLGTDTYSYGCGC